MHFDPDLRRFDGQVVVDVSSRPRSIASMVQFGGSGALEGGSILVSRWRLDQVTDTDGAAADVDLEQLVVDLVSAVEAQYQLAGPTGFAGGTANLELLALDGGVGIPTTPRSAILYHCIHEASIRVNIMMDSAMGCAYILGGDQRRNGGPPRMPHAAVYSHLRTILEVGSQVLLFAAPRDGSPESDAVSRLVAGAALHLRSLKAEVRTMKNLAKAAEQSTREVPDPTVFTDSLAEAKSKQAAAIATLESAGLVVTDDRVSDVAADRHVDVYGAFQYTQLIRTLPEPGPVMQMYSFWSGSTHGEVWRSARSMRRVETPTGPVLRYAEGEGTSFRDSLSIGLRVFAMASGLLFGYVGVDDAPIRAAMERLDRGFDTHWPNPTPEAANE